MTALAKKVQTPVISVALKTTRESLWGLHLEIIMPPSKPDKKPKPRRIRGEGGFYERADGLWIGVLDLGIHGGKRIRKTVSGRTKKACQQKFLDLKKEIEKGGGLTDDLTVADWLEHWLKYIVSERNEESTFDGYTSRVNTWLIPYLGKYRLDKLKEDHIRAMLRAMKDQGSSDGTQRRTHAVLHRALVVALQEGRINRNPAGMMDKPKTKVKHRIPLSIDEARQVLAHLDGNPLAARWVANLLQGMRQGECLALKWEDVDFVNNTISVHSSQYRRKKKGLSLKAPKSDAGTRVIPMIEPMRYALENTERRGEYVFYGEPKDSKADWNEWKKLLIDAGLFAEGTPFGQMPPLASGRPTTTTFLRDAGVDVTVIRDILGHSQVMVTQESYMRTDQVTKAKAMKALETSIAPTKKVTRKALPEKKSET